ncbi:MAG: Gfo/Idh/MocA family protein [bacterium]
MSNLRTGVIGVGHLGNHHARIYKQKGNLIGIYDIDPERAEFIANKYQCISFQSQDQLLEKVDAVSLATPASTHYHIAKQVLSRNKHLLVEKPITVHMQEAKQLIDIARNNNLVLQVGHSERFNPAYRIVKDIIKNPIFIESHRIGFPTDRGLDVAVVLDLMIHDIDIALQYINSPVKSISAIGAPILSNEIDIANARVEFENQAIANFMVSRVATKAKRKIRFFQADAYISVDYQERKVEICRRNFENGKGTIQMDTIEDAQGEPLDLEIDSFISSIHKNSHPEVDAQDALRALEVAWRIVEEIKKRLTFILHDHAENIDHHR